MKSPPATTPIKLNLAPMVDVSMCLLVFFLVTTKMVERENSEIDLPIARSALDLEKQDLGNRFVVNVRDARLSGGDGALYLVQEEALPLSEVLSRLQAARRTDTELNCVIRADRDLPYQYVRKVMIGCARADVRKITFGALRREGVGD